MKTIIARDVIRAAGTTKGFCPVGSIPAGYLGNVATTKDQLADLSPGHHRSDVPDLGPGIKEDAVSVYRVIDVIGTSTQSWEDAAVSAVSTARKSIRDLRVAEVVDQDLHVEDGGEVIFRTKLRLSFKYEDPT